MNLNLDPATYRKSVKLLNSLSKIAGFVSIPIFYLKTKKWFHRETSTHSPLPLEIKLKEKLELYESLLPTVQDSNGFIHTEYDSGDSLLFTGLLGAVCPKNIKIEAAKSNFNQWFRRPLNYPPVYPNDAASTISRDMFIGLFWFIWRNKRLDLAEELWTYGIAHDWIMGEGDQAEIYLTPNLQATLAEIIYRLGGKNHLIHRAIPQIYFKNVDFLAHLDMLTVLLRQELLGIVEEENLIDWQFHRQPQNPLFSYIYNSTTWGDSDNTANLLMYEKWWPSDKLPTDVQRIEPWIIQRDFGRNWEPSVLPTERAWSGADFIFVARLLLESSENEKR